MKTERQIEKKFCRDASLNGWIVRKLNFGEGWPDRMFLRDGNCMFIEFKRQNGKVSKLQAHVFDTLTEQGFPVCVLDDDMPYAAFAEIMRCTRGFSPDMWDSQGVPFLWYNLSRPVF